MVNIKDQIREYLAEHLAFVATVDAKGIPNVVPKGNIACLGKDELVFADLYSKETKKNLLDNNNIAITVINPAGYTGYQIKGRAKVIERGREFDELSRKASGAGQLNHPNAKYAVKIKVTKIIDIGYGQKQGKEV